MQSTELLDVVLGRNKDLLIQLRQQREKLERLSGRSHNRERGGEVEEILTRTDGDRGPARKALAKSILRSADSHERQTGIQGTRSKLSLTPKHMLGTAEPTFPSDMSSHSDRRVQIYNRLQDLRPSGTKSCLKNHSKDQKGLRSGVEFQSDECEEMPASDRHRLQPLLGYDWIAGVLDMEGSSIERSDEFYNDLRVFRSVNKDKCVNSSQAEFCEENHVVPPLLTDKNSPGTNMDTHQCTFSYRINSRLFPVPLHSQECCPVCKRHKSSHPHTTAEPALIRVNIPCSALYPPYKYKAHRRCSFDPSDSFGLSAHCLSGWSNTGQSSLPPPRSLDLRSSLDKKTPTESLSKDLKNLRTPNVSRNHQQIPDVTRLPRHQFHHVSPRRKRRSTSYTLC